MARALVLPPGKPHAHCCTACRGRYEDSCHEPLADGHCYACRTGKPVAQWSIDRQPASCCRQRGGTRAMFDADERSAYRLGGSATWRICKTCCRTHPFNPEERA